MAFQLSPGINISEIDLTNVTPAVATTEGAIAGVFRWGPTGERILVTSEKELASRFGKPATYYTNVGLTTTWTNHETWFSAANFLSYSDALFVTRVLGTGAASATSTNFTAKYAGKLGDSLRVSYCTAGNFAATESEETLTIQPSTNTGVATGFTTNAGITEYANVGDRIILNNGTQLVISAITTVAGTAPSTWTSTVTFTTKYTGVTEYAATFSTQWGDANLFDSAPSAGAVHIAVRDVDGQISGTAGAVLERWENVSTTAGSTKYDGSANFIVDVLEQNSAWIKVSIAQSLLIKAGTYSSGVTLTGGNDGADETTVAIGALAAGYDLYADASDVDISFVIQGKARDTTLANHIIDNICEVRRDCVAFISPELSDTTVDSIIDFASTLSSSTYAVVDSGYKYQYDKYADVYRWIPLNGDIAGLCARTDDVRDPWFSPAGYNRGNVKNVVKLLVNPNKSQRDLLYKNSINPVITQPGQGTVLFGDKTFTSTVSAFDRINVRRLFIVLEKTIGTAAKSTIFEFNDDFTRAQFKNLVEPFLRDVQGRRGIYDFRVVCDETNNTAQVIDANQFVGDIFIKPARSINFIQLNFVAVRSGVEFSEIVGQF
jgi:hypothetical protein